jgi:hypothetical protein
VLSANGVNAYPDLSSRRGLCGKYVRPRRHEGRKTSKSGQMPILLAEYIF